jgi:hypothetical protein
MSCDLLVADAVVSCCSTRLTALRPMNASSFSRLTDTSGGTVATGVSRPRKKEFGDIDRELGSVRRKGRRHGGCLGESKMQAHFRDPFIERLKLHAFRFGDERDSFGNDRQQNNALVQHFANV